MATTLPNTSGTSASSLPASGGSSSSTLSQWAGPYVTDMLGKAEAVAAQPYQVYGGPLTAGESGLQTKVFQGLGGLSFPTNLGKSFTDTGVAQSYMNPYLNQALQPQLAEMRRQSQINLLPMMAKFNQSGGLGGSRSVLAEAEANRGLQAQENQAIGNAYKTAFEQGMGQFNKEQEQQRGIVNLLADQGAAQRGIEAEGVKADLAEFGQQRDYPMKQLQFLQSMLQGLPISTVTNTPSQPSGIGELSANLGGLRTLMDTLKGLGVNFSG